MNRTALAACIAALSVFTITAAAGAQETAASATSINMETIREMLMHGFEQNKAMDLEYCEAIPDSALRWRPTPEVRDYAQQLEHGAVEAARVFVAGAVTDAPLPNFGDPQTYLNEKAALGEVITASYDYVLQSLRDLPADELAAETTLFGETLPKWRVYLQALEHAYWTRGQTVPYLRINGVQPPGYRAF